MAKNAKQKNYHFACWARNGKIGTFLVKHSLGHLRVKKVVEECYTTAHKSRPLFAIVKFKAHYA